MDLTHRVLEGELMDAPDLEASKHHRALKGLERVNRLSGTGAIIARAIRKHCRVPNGSNEPLRILDLACGGGDVTLSVAQQLASSGVDVIVEGWDRSATAIEYAAARAQRLHSQGQFSSAQSVHFAEHDVIDLNPALQFDVVMCTLFLHHLSQEQAIDVLKRMGESSRQLMLVDDLRRTWFGFRLAQLGCQLLSRSPIVHVDGPLSVRAAFTENELARLSDQAGLHQPQVKRHWPQRFLASWKFSS